MVDELCQKLKEINSESIVNTETASTTTKYNEASPQELANQYYAAFPPLSRKSAASSPGVISIVPKWIGSPKKKQLRKQNRSASYDDKFHCKVESENMKARVTGKSRFNYVGRNKKDVGYCRNMAKSVERSDGINDWDLYTFNSMKNRRPNHWPTEKELTHKTNVVKISKNSEQCIENNQDLWMNDVDDNMNMYDDLLDDIRELLNSPEPQEDTVALMNLANMRDTGNKSFIQCGTNITSSIWSTNIQNESSENVFNAALASQNSDVLLGIKFSSISIGGNDFTSDGWPSSDTENKANLLFENSSKSSKSNHDFQTNNDVFNFRWDSFVNLEKWSDAESYEEDIMTVHNIMAKSLMKLNHHKEKSSFTEVIPRTMLGSTLSAIKKSSFLKPDVASTKVEAEKDKEDLLTSVRSHFKPINEKHETRGQQYADGTSFVIPNALDKINYRRSESGIMYIDSEYGLAKKYLEYKREDGTWNTSGFVLKFNICQNDKACQTDFGNAVIELEEEIKTCDQSQFFFPDDGDGDEDFLKEDCKHDGSAMKMDSSSGNDTTNYSLQVGRPNSIMGEFIWKCETKHCDKCNNNTSAWNKDQVALDKFDVWQKQTVDNIWSGGDVCLTCLGGNISSYQPLNQQQTQLREDISHDGEQLLSDLSSLQKCYMDELPNSEISCNISELIEPKDRKRRHSNFSEDIAGGQRGSWSFASRLKEDCLIQMSTIPTLRSVTL